MSKRFITDNNNIMKVDNIIEIVGDEVHHINVLRYKVGDTLYINEYEVMIEKISKDIIIGKIVGNMPQKGEPPVSITLLQSYLKSDKMEYVVQKAVELGAKSILPAISKNTVVKFDGKDKLKKKERLIKIAKEAVEQCGRTDSVFIDDIKDLRNVDFSVYDIVIVCHESSNISLSKTIDKLKKSIDIKNVAVVIGPEGGLDENEVKNILSFKNSFDVSLGERILRAETASFMILSILSYEFELN